MQISTAVKLRNKEGKRLPDGEMRVRCESGNPLVTLQLNARFDGQLLKWQPGQPLTVTVSVDPQELLRAAGAVGIVHPEHKRELAQ